MEKNSTANNPSHPEDIESWPCLVKMLALYIGLYVAALREHVGPFYTKVRWFRQRLYSERYSPDKSSVKEIAGPDMDFPRTFQEILSRKIIEAEDAPTIVCSMSVYGLLSRILEHLFYFLRWRWDRFTLVCFNGILRDVRGAAVRGQSIITAEAEAVSRILIRRRENWSSILPAKEYMDMTDVMAEMSWGFVRYYWSAARMKLLSIFTIVIPSLNNTADKALAEKLLETIRLQCTG
ncbi:hypothetical protein HD806DRAFT_521005 [Xylariaceae sp. AK1471]|nr:hypothetical protein HD806DRAFT_521005 [Xylariaceae sp. AK1471]